MRVVEKEYPYDQNVVTIGGGGGSYTVLRGLTELNYPPCNTAIFGTWDNGGRSGPIRLKEGVMPPGDYFMCLYGMMEDQRQVKAAFTMLNNRNEDPMLRDRIAVAAERQYHGIVDGVDGIRSLLRVQGNLIPVSNIDLTLFAETKTGHIIEGETKIDTREEAEDFDPADVTSNIFFNVEAPGNPKALEAILKAYKVIINPGSPYTSILPHLLVNGISEAIRKSEADLIVVPNLTTAKGEDHHLNTFTKWLREFQFLLGEQDNILKGDKSRIDYLIINNEPTRADVAEAYQHKGQYIVEFDEEECRKLARSTRIVKTELLDQEELNRRFIRHDSLKLAHTILSLKKVR